MSGAPTLPPITGSPNPLNDDDDNESNGSGTSSDDEFQVQTTRKGARGDPNIAGHPIQQNQHDSARDSMQYSSYNPTVDGSMMTQGSWYFHPSQGSQWGGAPTDGGAPPAAGAPLPPHLAYWMAPQGNMSDLTYSGYQPGGYGGLQGGQMAGGAMGGAPGGEGLGGGGGKHPSMKDLTHLLPDEDEYKVYNSRWIMLGYMSMLNLLSDWTCYSVAPIAILTIDAFGDVDPESLVTVFLGANAVASAMEPAILGRLGLRKTVLFGGFLLMIGSIIKSGGFKSIVMSTKDEEALLEEEEEDITWRLYLGFFLVGLSQPLYQCTPALLSASWFPENERTMATGVALNSNQLGIGCAFVFGTVLVSTVEDIIPYFGLLSIIATITFIGVALQFEDAPPTPPSDTARVMKGDLEIKLPKFPFFGGFGRNESKLDLMGEAVDAAADVNESVEVTLAGIHDVEGNLNDAVVAAPSPAPTDEPVGQTELTDDKPKSPGAPENQQPIHAQHNHPLQSPGAPPVAAMPPYPNPYPYMPPPGYYPTPNYPAPAPQMGYSTATPSFYHGYDDQGHYHNALLENADDYDYAPFAEDEGAEPIMTQLDHQLDIDIRDDQLIQQVKACFRRKGFAHCVVAFTTSGIIINTLSTFMDYLVTLNGAGREYVGITGGMFQVLIMCSSLVFGGWTDHSRKYYFVILGMLIFGAFALSVCNVNLDSDAGGDLRMSLLIVAVMAGPLQPISTELGVEVVYPLSENTVLVIQQLFSNLLSAAFIPVFKALRNVGTNHSESEVKSMFEVPQYTFSFYMLIIIHAVSTCYFATFDGQYLRYDAEEAKKAKKAEEREKLLDDLKIKHGQKPAAAGGYGSIEPN